jgi:hypothetical protein
MQTIKKSYQFEGLFYFFDRIDRILLFTFPSGKVNMNINFHQSKTNIYLSNDKAFIHNIIVFFVGLLSDPVDPVILSNALWLCYERYDAI